MTRYIVCSINLKPSKIKGSLPDVSYTFISVYSHIGHHYEITNDREDAYEFEEFELKEAEFIADCWGMEIKKLI
ncbi:hypothetical protein B4102_3609 [Heyndrickxia sporothermodurans]|uniref:Uncharacterized protein n=1 Tax=Heyndrickxia sporothermodurans TaxID=46224 RepID=A0A150KP16_9BACI|nr:hypothetical protein [Heyndrickxia sporothermodurans]KYC94388.1 hypothetical protein B4102_3609 [Heyndrickxia sporothermodurans]